MSNRLSFYFAFYYKTLYYAKQSTHFCEVVIKVYNCY